MHSQEEELRRKKNTDSQSLRQKRKAIVADYKRGIGCQECGETNPDALDFHHILPKEKSFTIAKALHTVSLMKLFDEIAKCEVLCANCHRKKHA